MNLHVNGVDLYLRDAGPVSHESASRRPDEPTLLFLHYWGGSSRTWSEVIGHLPGHRTVALDQRGWGDSTRTAARYTIGDLADDAEAVVTALKLSSYVLVGHSMGGKAAQLLASRRPPGLAGMVLVAPSPAGGVRIPDAQRASMLEAYDSPAAIEATVDQVLSGRRLTGEIRQRVIDDSLRGAPAAKKAWPTSAIAEDVSADIARIAVPTLVISGTLDRVDPVPLVEREVVARIPGAKLATLPGVGHLSPLEAPAELAQLIAAFVAELG